MWYFGLCTKGIFRTIMSHSHLQVTCLTVEPTPQGMTEQAAQEAQLLCMTRSKVLDPQFSESDYNPSRNPSQGACPFNMSPFHWM